MKRNFSSIRKYSLKKKKGTKATKKVSQFRIVAVSRLDLCRARLDRLEKRKMKFGDWLAFCLFLSEPSGRAGVLEGYANPSWMHHSG